MSASTSQSEHIVEIENKEKEHEIKNYESVIEEHCPDGTEKYFAISPEDDFLVEFKIVDLDSWDSSDSSDSPEFELKMYDIINLKNEDGLTSEKDLKPENDSKSEKDLKPENEPNLGDEQELSYRKFSRIHTTKLPFTETQISLIKNVPKPIVRWSVAVSDKSSNSPKFRLLAISCISIKDMEYYKEHYKKIGPKEIQNIQNNGFTFVFIINNDCTISNPDDKELLIKCGGIVKLFYEKDYIADQDADGHFLILLILSGIYKYHVKNKSTYNIQKLKYPKRIYNRIIANVTHFFDSEFSCKGVYYRICKYIHACMNKHYFLVDTLKEDIKYLELYDLKTNQLVNIFQRQILGNSNMWEYPSYFAISNNGKLLAYLSFPIRGITIYSIECGLEIAELANILDTSIFKTADHNDLMFLYFFHNDEKLLIYFSEYGYSSSYEPLSSSSVWAVWDIFSSLRSSVKLTRQKFILNIPSMFSRVEKSNSCIVVYQNNNTHDKLFIYDELVVDKYFKLRESDKQDWITRDFEDLNEKSELELDKLDKLYEPWLPIASDGIRSPKEDDIQYSFYLDKKKERLLIIGNHTVQVWYRGTLKFIHSPSPFFDVPDFSDINFNWNPKKIKVIGIEYCSEKFKFNIQIEDNEGIKQIKMEDEDDIMNVAIYACYTLEYFSVYKKKLHPTEWRLLDIRFDLMSTLIKAGERELVYYILFFGEPIHIPHFPWSGEKNKSTTIRTALSDNTMLACFLEYYSNNAVHNIGWMNTVVDIIPELFKSNEGNEIKEKHHSNNAVRNVELFKITENSKNEKENYKYYAQKLFYSHCFCDKEFDLLSFEILEVSPKSNDLLKVYIPITQFIPQNSELDLQEIEYENNHLLLNVYIKKGKLTKFLEILFSPSRYLSPGEVDHSPFIKFIETGERDILYENPSMGAVINWMWYSSKFYWPKTLYIFALFLLLGYSSSLGLNQASEELDNPFSNIIYAILAVYDWSSISFDTWNFWPLTIISVIGSFIFVIILQNVIISFMSEAFSNAVEDSKRGVYRYQIDLIRDFAHLEKSLEFNNLDSKFKDKIIAKYICFYDNPRITNSWKETSEQVKSKPYPKMQTLRAKIAQLYFLRQKKWKNVRHKYAKIVQFSWIPFNEFKNPTKIAKGGFSTIFSASWFRGRTQLDVALKLIHNSSAYPKMFINEWIDSIEIAKQFLDADEIMQK
ncbi:8250_t:CDS:10 [Dentiscutata erythropus]|uniref:8250_t:CDS:1 n=1 Tax=Dentiscutata erythropus TaxID=1348616 RepID=A0A9N8WQC9_9GLOM|nr:8250_t:CDS:10 [Dentiscutata erythropus]